MIYIQFSNSEEVNEMNFNSLSIEKSWRSKELEGKIRFSSKSGDITLNLNQGHIDRIFEVVADTMIEVAKDAARELTCTVIEHKKSIESKEGK